jgi:hypothetical protein
MDLCQSLRELPILTAVIGAECSDEFVLVVDTRLTRGKDQESFQYSTIFIILVIYY